MSTTYSASNQHFFLEFASGKQHINATTAGSFIDLKTATTTLSFEVVGKRAATADPREAILRSFMAQYESGGIAIATGGGVVQPIAFSGSRYKRPF